MVTRREWLAASVAGLVTARLPAAAPPAALPDDARPARLTVRTPGLHDYRAALAAIRAAAEAELDATGLPGMTLAIASEDGLAATLSLGWADLAGRVPVSSDQLFQIGSISKSLTGLWLNAAADKGRLSLGAPASLYLPDLPLPAEPITIQQLLNHSGGLPDDAPLFPRVPGGRLWTGFAPGARLSYSNTGYDLLGLVVDRIAGRPHAQVLQQDVLAPLGMAGALAHIRTADRPRYATGYVQLLDDRPALTRMPLIAGPWTEGDDAAGSVAAPAIAMIGYLRYVIQLGRNAGGPLLSDRAAEAMLAAEVAAPIFGVRARYASGFATQTIDGHRLLHHTGGMLAFSSSFHVDAPTGVGCFASVNARLGDYRPRKVTSYAVAALRAARLGRAIPPVPDMATFGRIREPRRFVGLWRAETGEQLELQSSGSGLALVADGARGRLEAIDERSFATDHPTRSRHPLAFEPARGTPTRLWWAGTPFGRSRPAALPDVPAELRALKGEYVARDPWGTSLSVFARGDRLWAEPVGEIVRRAGGFWSAAEDKGGVDRIWFEAPIAGRPSRANVNGIDAVRIA